MLRSDVCSHVIILGASHRQQLSAVIVFSHWGGVEGNDFGDFAILLVN